MNLIKKIVTAIKHPGAVFHPNTWCNEAYVNYLRERGSVIGEGTRFISPSRCNVDINRADYIKIGRNCCLSVVSTLAHDYSWYTMLESKNDLLPDPGGEVIIGDNCFVGFQALILKNTHIGDNVIIGARSVVKGTIPSNTVWAGVPARQVCTLDEFYERRKTKSLIDAYYRRDHIKERYHRNPSIKDMGWFAFLFLERTSNNYEMYIKNLEFNGIKDCKLVRNRFFTTQPIFRSFEDFLASNIETE